MREFVFGVDLNTGSISSGTITTEYGDYEHTLIVKGMNEGDLCSDLELIVRTWGKETPVMLKNGWELQPRVKLICDARGYKGELILQDFSGNQFIKIVKTESRLPVMSAEELVDQVMSLLVHVSEHISVLDVELHQIIETKEKDKEIRLPDDLDRICRVRELYDMFIEQQRQGLLDEKQTVRLQQEFRFILNQIGERLVAL
ncbi:MAG: hypothetical protein ACRCSQ_05385 [Bacteroidales bacterium]